MATQRTDKFTDKHNSLPMTLSAFTELLGFDNEKEFKDWARNTMLPKLGAHLELLQVIHEDHKFNQSPSHDEVLRVIEKNSTVISQNSENFVRGGEWDIKSIWAHSVFLIRQTIMDRPSVKQGFNTQTKVYSLAFDMLKMFNKNRGEKRSFRPELTPEWEKARAALVQLTGWNLRDAHLIRKASVQGSAPPQDQPTDMSADTQNQEPKNQIKKNKTKTRQDSSNSLFSRDIQSMRAQIAPKPAAPTPMIFAEYFPKSFVVRNPVATRSRDCTLAEFKIWADETFNFTLKGEVIGSISIFDEAEDEVLVANEADWADYLQSKICIVDGDHFVRVIITASALRRPTVNTTQGPLMVPAASKSTAHALPTNLVQSSSTAKAPVAARTTVQVPVINTAQTSPPTPSMSQTDLGHFEHLSEDPKKPGKYYMYQRRVDRTLEETSKLITDVLSVSLMGKMAVNKTPAIRVTPASLNFEAVNPFDEEGGEFESIQTPQYDIVQHWLSDTNPKYRKAGKADKALRSWLGFNAQIVDRLPDRRIEDPNNPGNGMPGEAHKPHQKVGLYWAISMEKSLKRGICADGCGTGKSHAIRAHIRGAHLYWERQGKPATQPTLVVVPSNLVEKTYDDLYDGMGIDWQVYRYGQRVGNLPLHFDPAHTVYQSPNAGKVVVVVSLGEIQHAKSFEAVHEGLFIRIIIDEAQAIRRCDQTVQGRILKSFKAPFRFLYTGSLVVDTIRDIDGYLAFLEDPAWSDPRDQNLATVHDDHRNQYSEFLVSLNGPSDAEGPSLESPPAEFSTPMLGWDWDCESVDEDKREEEIRKDWFCSHFPAGLRYNRKRAASLARSAPKKRREKEESSAGVPPFEENPYDTYHQKNKNKIRCLTTTAFRYWVRDHMSQRNMTDASMDIVARRVQIILRMLVLSRNLQSKIMREDGTVVTVGEDLPSLSMDTQDLRYLPDELEVYKERAQQCATAVISDITRADISRLGIDVDNGTRKVGSKFAKLSVLCTHLGLSAFQRVPTLEIRRRHPEGLPMLVARMKTAGALNPDDIDIPLNSDREILRQFLWGSPKMRFLLWEIQRVILGNERPPSHRKIFATFQWPRAAEMCLKLVEFLGIKATLLDSTMTSTARYRTIRNFDTYEEPQFLIAGYTLNIAGHDMQHRCSYVAHIEPAFNLATEHQMAARVHRIGQKEDVQVVRFFVENTYQEQHEYFMLKKANTMFAAYKALYEAWEETQDESTNNFTPADIARGAFGIFRNRYGNSKS